MARPTFTPAVGLAGSVTHFNISGVTAGDFVVLKPDNCSNAHAALTGANALGVTSITSTSTPVSNASSLVSFHFASTTAMTAVGTLKVCYASLQSGGNSADDFVALDVDFVQRSVPQFAPNRLIEGTSQKLLVLSLIHI